MAASRLSKGKIEEVVKKFRWFPLARPEKYGGSYLKNAWAEIPEVIISLACSVASMGMLAYLYQKNEQDLRYKDRPYKRFYTVYRPDDERIANLRARPQYYNPDGVIPDPKNTETDEVRKWHGVGSEPTKADGSFFKHTTMKAPK